MSNPIVVDLSHWNPEPDWLALKDGGTLGVILKATQGTSYIDPTFHDRARDAVKAGLYVTAYHFLEHGNIPDQIMHYTETLEFMHGLVLPRAVIDYEDTDDGSPDLSDLIGAVDALKMLGYQVAIYSGHKIKEDVGTDYYGGLAGTSLWIAHYTENDDDPTWPKTQWPVWDLWQYTDKADVVGISDPVDGNRANVLLEPWFYPGEPEPEGSREFVSLSIDVSDGVALKIFVNGEPYG